jgi:crossover junction endodeoxyribonuclease RusA
MIRLTLPWPPSNNVYFRHLANGRTLISREGRAYRASVWAVWLLQGRVRPVPLAVPIKVTIEAYFPNEIRRDLDNLPKAIMDSLTKAGAWSDDSLAEDLRIVRRRPNVPGGQIKIEIEAI